MVCENKCGFKKKAKCLIEKSSKRSATFSESGVKAYISNTSKSKYCYWKVDGCLIKGDAKRCDFLICASGQLTFIELKRSDCDAAAKQLESAVDLLRNDPENPVNAVVVSCKSPFPKSWQRSILSLARKKNIRLRFQRSAVQFSI